MNILPNNPDKTIFLAYSDAGCVGQIVLKRGQGIGAVTNNGLGKMKNGWKHILVKRICTSSGELEFAEV